MVDNFTPPTPLKIYPFPTLVIFICFIVSIKAWDQEYKTI